MLEKLDYQAVGLISGLEVHQQLLTAQKLFCRCPAGLYTEDHDARCCATCARPFWSWASTTAPPSWSSRPGRRSSTS